MKRRDFLVGGAVTFGSAVLHQNHVYLTATALAGGETTFGTAILQPAVVSSAGIFDMNGKLVRTLWGAVTAHPNMLNPEDAWDGTLDDGTVAPTGNYQTKLICHNISYTWEGVVGNSSPNHVDVWNYHNPACVIRDLVITDAGEMYYITSYDERNQTTHVTTTANPQVSEYISKTGYTFWQRATSIACCTDDTNIYFARWAPFNVAAESYVWACSCADYHCPENPDYQAIVGAKQMVTFQYGVTLADMSVIGRSTTSQFILDIAVQKTGNFLFIARIESESPPVQSIWTLNKTTGQVLQHNDALDYSISIVAEVRGAIATSPTTGELWVLHSTNGTSRNAAYKLTADGNGVLT